MRRQVFFIGGFDPRGAAHYHRLYRAEAAAQQAVSGQTYAVSPRGKRSAVSVGWEVSSDGPEGRAHTRYELLQWDALVRSHWLAPGFGLLRAYLLALAGYARTGTLWQLGRLAWRPALMALYPFLVFAGVLLGAALLGRLAAALLPALPWLQWGGGALTALAAYWLGSRLADRSAGADWLARSMAFHWRQARGLADLDARVQAFAARIREQLSAEKVDEVLLVGHSSGSVLAASVMAHLCAEPAAQRVKLLTLGSCLPILSLLPAASGFRAELAQLAQHPGLLWLDVAAKVDAVAFYRVDPLASAGLTAGRVQLKGAPFHTLFAPARYAWLRRNKFRMHEQYLLAGEQKGG